MENKLKILHLEDLRSDAILVERALKKSDIAFEKIVVDTRIGFTEALKNFIPDVILSDHSLPAFNSHDALDIMHEAGLLIPFILITANISEEFAVDVLKRGADDYILKDRLQRLPTAIKNSVEKFRLEKERQHFVDEIIRKEKHYRALIENIHDAIILVDADEKTCRIILRPAGNQFVERERLRNNGQNSTKRKYHGIMCNSGRYTNQKKNAVITIYGVLLTGAGMVPVIVAQAGDKCI